VFEVIRKDNGEKRAMKAIRKSEDA
jgi:calcium-dependent protein kinase